MTTHPSPEQLEEAIKNAGLSLGTKARIRQAIAEATKPKPHPVGAWFRPGTETTWARQVIAHLDNGRVVTIDSDDGILNTYQAQTVANLPLCDPPNSIAFQLATTP